MSEPFRLAITGVPPVTFEQLHENARRNAHHPKAKRRKLAVVGGAPGLVDRLDELRAWDGEIWAINRTADYLAEHGIRCRMFSIDPLFMPIKCQDRILATACHPDMFVGNVEAFDLIETHPDGIGGGQSSAMRAPYLGLRLGFTSISFFGCDGSFTDATHIDRDERHDPFVDHVDHHLVVVRAGGQDYTVTTDMLLQCEELSQLIRTLDGVLVNRSGGLLAAMIEHPDTWAIAAVSAGMKKHLESINGAQGLYNEPYRPAA